MGKPFDKLSRRNFKTAKFTSLVSLALARLTVLKNQLQVRYRQAMNDILQLLQMGLLERALNRVEYLIRDQNTLDAYIMIENYCNILLERAYLIEQSRECPDELKEPIASLVYGSKRCGEYPELQEMCVVFANHYGKDFVARAMELRHSCGVNPEMIKKLSTRQQASMETRLEILKGIASENNIALQLDEQSPTATEANQRANESRLQESGSLIADKDEMGGEKFVETIKETKKFKDAAEAAQTAFESAAYAAAAAKAAVELTRAQYHDPGRQMSRKRSGKGSFPLNMEESVEENVVSEPNVVESRVSSSVRGTYSDSATVEHEKVDEHLATEPDSFSVGENAEEDSDKKIPSSKTDLNQASRSDAIFHIFSHMFGRKKRTFKSKQVSGH